MTGRLMLLDAASLYFRAFHAIPETITAPDGTPVGAVRGLLDMIARLVREYRPEQLVACMDADWRPEFRVSALPMYKAHRVAPDGGEQIPAGLVPQVPLIEQVLDAVGLARVGVAGYEADDVIGTLATRPGRPVDIVSGDRDLFQLVDDSVPVRVLYTARGIANIVVVDEAEVTRRYTIPGRSYADYALLRGDPSDGLPGVAGIGEKTAATLITRYGGLEEVLAAAERRELAAPVVSKLAAAHDYLSSAALVVCVAKDVPLPAFDPVLPAAPRQPELLEELRDRWALSGPVERLRAALAKDAG